MPDGAYKDVAHPINMDFRKRLEDQILVRYQAEIKKCRDGQPASAAPRGQP
jgi:DNA-binding cell septation regulator SpoVG